MRCGLWAIFVLLALAHAAIAAERSVATGDELRAAIKAAGAGDVIVLRDGTWTDVAIDVTTPQVTLRAQTPARSF